MYERLFIGNNIVSLDEIDSTNLYLKEHINRNAKEIEGLVVTTKSQTSGRGQKGNIWKSEKGKNLTFSIYLKPTIAVNDQFLVSKVISLGIIDFLSDLGLQQLKIKWPNDIYCKDRKIAGILIENAIRENKIISSVVGIGLNVNQLQFDLENKPTSILMQLGGESFNLNKLLDQLLFFIEKRYMILKKDNNQPINEAYISLMYGIGECKKYEVNNEILEGTILGVNGIGRLELEVNNEIKSLDLKEVKFL